MRESLNLSGFPSYMNSLKLFSFNPFKLATCGHFHIKKHLRYAGRMFHHVSHYQKMPQTVFTVYDLIISK